MNKAKYQVTGTVTFRFDIDVEAESDDAAERRIRDMSFPELIEGSGEPAVEIDSVEIDSVDELNAKPAKKTKKGKKKP